MDLVSSCKEKLLHFRIKELKDVLTQLGCSKQGKKQDLVDRIFSILCDERGSSTWSKKNAFGKEEVARLVDDIYRKLPVNGATDLASKSQAASDSGTKLKEEVEEAYQMVVNTRCPCGSSLQTDSMIKCEDPRCHVWQHIGCVLIPDKPTDGVIPATPDIFYCEICRINRGDPFLMPVGHPLSPVKLITTTIPTDGTNPMQKVEKTFQLNRAEKDMLLKQEHDVQAWCMLLNDKVPFRMHWPQYAELLVNDVPVRAINRPGSQLLGTNGRDEGPIITKCTRDGINKISLTGVDSRVFCLGVRLVRRRTFEQVLNMIPKESVGEKFEDALARVCRCVGGGNATGKADDSDSDLEVVADCIPVSLRCPMSASRMKIAGRFKPCLHMGCFDLEVFLRMNERSRKWQCPNCVKNYALENLIIDPYFNPIISKIQNCGEDISEIEVKPDGSWRAKAESDRRELGELGLWHFGDGSLCPEVKPELEALKHVKQEGGGSDSRPGLILGIKKNCNGSWKVSKQEALQDNFENHPLNNIIPMSSSATGSGRDGEDASVNGGGNFEFSVNNGVELDSISLNLENRFGFPNQNPSAPLKDQEVIVLSDSEDENDDIIMPSSRNVYTNSIEETGVAAGIFPIPPHGIPIPDPFPEDAIIGTTGMGLFNSSTDDDFGIWPLPSGSQPGSSSFQLFSPEADGSNSLVGLPHGSISCPTMMNGYNLNPETDIVGGTAVAALAHESSVDNHSSADMNGGLVDNPLAFGGNDPSLQIFLPTRPSADASPSIQLDVRNQPEASTNIRSSVDWISLRVGDSGSNGNNNHNESGIPNGVSPQQQQQQQLQKDGSLSCLADSASLLLSMTDNRNGKTVRERSDSPFTFPRQKRSVRPKLYLSIDTDSE
ncbi:E3 SUMO-protein ligase SIZ1-like [Impatiens glandulifera]|uniref:E3 SUMO-protein ligase SIZ1-like n=1 Tax=Impatiens glandulifera TaxID=253017 RepID=UPI001FB16805|nr:E3 SUMO-protein ligase SIZ1-like [Impatiens glandulifera]XP_047317784.1 E3 SUMO-protein ligase SIZ1-like [Impatiens glandulifera]